MSTSEYGYVVAMDTSVQLVANEPCDTIAAALLLNNVNHLSDEFAQVRVNWTDAGLIPADSAGWTQILAFDFPVTLRQSGDAYKFRVRLGGYASSGVAQFRAILSAPGAQGPNLRGGVGFGDQDFITGAAVVGTPGWIAGVSQGPAASATLISLPAALVGTLVQSTLTTVGGTVAQVTVPAARLTVYGLSSKPITDPPILCGVYLAEYVGQ